MTVWDELVGQEKVIAELQAAVADAQAILKGGAGPAMTHAWLFTGPPGSGRSTAARAFAAALQCEQGGCGVCHECRTAMGGTHADVELVTTNVLSIGVDLVRDVLIPRANLVPSGRRWNVIVIEDADRLTESAANTLLKSLEEPVTRTVWMLCVPSLEEALPTIRSRCRHVQLRTPPAEAIATLLSRRDGVDPAMAAFAARAAQGHIGRAKRLATDEGARLRRAEVLRLPDQISDLGSSIVAAANLVEAASEEAKAASVDRFARERDELGTALGVGTTGRRAQAGTAKQLKDLEKEQERRLKRSERDVLDLALLDIVSFYRDVLAVQIRSGVELVNSDLRRDVVAIAQRSSPEDTLRRIDAVLEARESIAANVAPLLAVEAMAVSLR